MKLIPILILLLSYQANLFASTGVTRSAGKLVNNTNIQLEQKLLAQPEIQTELTADSGSNQQYKLSQHPGNVTFEIYDAWTEMTGDMDYDGFYHQIKVTFDADTNTPEETVYAKLYLSFEGGSWYQYAETDLFNIHYDDTSDSYEIITELIDGYDPGYYEVMIELYSFQHSGMVARRIISTDNWGDHLSLEDQYYDERYNDDYYVESYYEVGAGGSLSSIALLVLFIILLVKIQLHRRDNCAHLLVEKTG